MQWNLTANMARALLWKWVCGEILKRYYLEHLWWHSSEDCFSWGGWSCSLPAKLNLRSLKRGVKGISKFHLRLRVNFFEWKVTGNSSSKAAINQTYHHENVEVSCLCHFARYSSMYRTSNVHEYSGTYTVWKAKVYLFQPEETCGVHSWVRTSVHRGSRVLQTGSAEHDQNQPIRKRPHLYWSSRLQQDHMASPRGCGSQTKPQFGLSNSR